jgi:hypothetical protein
MWIASDLGCGLDVPPYDPKRARKLIKEKIFHPYPGRVYKGETRHNRSVMNHIVNNPSRKLQSSRFTPPTPGVRARNRKPTPAPGHLKPGT